MLKLTKKLAIWVDANTKPAPGKHESIRIAVVDLFVFKKVKTGEYPNKRDAIASLIIPKGAYLHLPEVGNGVRAFRGKFRASRAMVHSIVSYKEKWIFKGNIQVDLKIETEAYSQYTSHFKYHPGKDVAPGNRPFSFYDEECDPGIHFFLHSKQALDY